MISKKVKKKTLHSIGQKLTYLHEAGPQPMSSTYSMNARKCFHGQKPYPTQAFAYESSKVGGRGKRDEERDRKDRGQETDGKKGSPTKQKYIGVSTVSSYNLLP